MTVPLLYALVGAALFGITLYALIVEADALRRLIALNVMSSGVFLVLVALARRSATQTDPVPQAMVITGIVVAISASALAIVLICRLGAGASAGTPGEEP